MIVVPAPKTPGQENVLGIVAGAGSFPVDLAARCRAEGRPVHIARIAGVTDAALDGWPGHTAPLGMIGAHLRQLSAAGCDRLMFCGKILRPAWAELRLDGLGLRCLVRILVRGWGRDDTLQRVISNVIEQRGISVIGPADLWPDLLAPAEQLTATGPSDEAWASIRAGAAAALKVGREDKGQAAIARGGAVVAVEDRGHTDGLLRRAIDAGSEGGVLVKLAKPQQDRRLDLPVIGPDTIELAAQAGLQGIAVEAGAVILARRATLIEAAERAGLFVIGFEVSSL